MSEGIWAPGCLFPLTEIVFTQVEAKGNEMLKSLHFERERGQVRGVSDAHPFQTWWTMLSLGPLLWQVWGGGVFHVLSLEVSFKLYILCFW